MAWTTPRDWTDTETVTAAIQNLHIRDNLAYLKTIEVAHPLISPSARVYNDAAISIDHNTVTALTFNSERWDTNTIHSVLLNTGRLTCATAGIYSIFGHVRFAEHNTGNRILAIRLNGSDVYSNHRQDAVQGAQTPMSISTHISLAASDYVELTVYQTSGGALNIESSDMLTPEFGMTYLGKAS